MTEKKIGKRGGGEKLLFVARRQSKIEHVYRRHPLFPTSFPSSSSVLQIEPELVNVCVVPTQVRNVVRYVFFLPPLSQFYTCERMCRGREKRVGWYVGRIDIRMRDGGEDASRRGPFKSPPLTPVFRHIPRAERRGILFTTPLHSHRLEWKGMWRKRAMDDDNLWMAPSLLSGFSGP